MLNHHIVARIELERVIIDYWHCLAVISQATCSLLLVFGCVRLGYRCNKQLVHNNIIIIIIILSFDIAPFPYKHVQRHITFHCQRIDVDIHIVN